MKTCDAGRLLNPRTWGTHRASLRAAFPEGAEHLGVGLRCSHAADAGARTVALRGRGAEIATIKTT